MHDFLSSLVLEIPEESGGRWATRDIQENSVELSGVLHGASYEFSANSWGMSICGLKRLLRKLPLAGRCAICSQRAENGALDLSSLDLHLGRPRLLPQICEAVGLIREKLGPPPASIGQMR